MLLFLFLFMSAPSCKTKLFFSVSLAETNGFMHKKTDLNGQHFRCPRSEKLFLFIFPA